MARDPGLGLAPVLGALALLVVEVGVAVFWPSPSTSLRIDNPRHNSASAAIDNIPARTPYLFAKYPLCVAHGSVTIDKVEPNAPHTGIEVVDWAVATKAESYSARGQRGRVGTSKEYRGHLLSAPCSAPVFLAISVQRMAADARTNGFIVRSSSGSVVIPLAVRLCPTKCASGISYSGTP